MQEKTYNTLLNRCFYVAGDKLLVGVSGGPDSIALLHLLHSKAMPLIVAHLDHGLREDSRSDFLAVQNLSQHFGLVFRGDKVDTNRYAKKHKLTIEEAARELRYRFLFTEAKRNNCSAVVVGHTADDQVETILMHFLRGAGLDGLAGMEYRSLTHWDVKLPLLRPLLGVWRTEILEYCEENNLSPRFDRSNLDTTYFRNRVRHDLLPQLNEFNPNIKEILWKTANTLGEDKKVLEGVTKDVLKKIITESGDGFCCMDTAAFLNLQTGLQRKVLKRCYSELRPEIRDIGYELIEKGLQLLRKPPKSKSADLFGGLNLWIGDDWFMLFDKNLRLFPHIGPQMRQDIRYQLHIPGEQKLEGGWVMIIEPIDPDQIGLEKVYDNESNMTAFVDSKSCSEPFLLRTRIPGDRFSPLGMAGKTTKLSDYMINVKMPEIVRDTWPVLKSGGDIIWVPGYQISEEFRVTSKTTEILKFTLLRKQSE